MPRTSCSPTTSLRRSFGIEPALFANAFVNSRPFVTSNIIGATSMAQLETALDFGRRRLDRRDGTGGRRPAPEARQSLSLTASYARMDIGVSGLSIARPQSPSSVLSREGAMLRIQKIDVDSVYVPTARRKTLHPETVRTLAEDILENGLKTPIQVRHDGKRHVLVEGLHRLEAANGSAKRRSTHSWCRPSATDAAPRSEPAGGRRDRSNVSRGRKRPRADVVVTCPRASRPSLRPSPSRRRARRPAVRRRPDRTPPRRRRRRIDARQLCRHRWLIHGESGLPQPSRTSAAAQMRRHVMAQT